MQSISLIQGRTGAWLEQLPWPIVALLSTCIVGAKSLLGADRVLTEANWIPASQALPRATEYYSSSIGLPALAKLLGATSQESWFLVGLALFLLCLLLTFLVVARVFAGAPQQRALWIAVVAFLPATNVAALEVDRGTGLFVLGAVLLAVGARPVSLITGLGLMLLAHPEQALIATGAAFLVAAGIGPGLRRRFGSAFVLSILAFAVIQAWLVASGVVSSRLVLLGQFLGSSLVANTSQWPWLLYAFGGLLWPVLGVAGLRLWTCMTPRRRVIAATGLLIVPVLATLITADGVRVLAPTSSLSILVLIGCWMKATMAEPPVETSQATGSLLLWAIVLPPVMNNWQVAGAWLMTPVASFIESTTDPLRTWLLDRFPSGEI